MPGLAAQGKEHPEHRLALERQDDPGGRRGLDIEGGPPELIGQLALGRAGGLGDRDLSRGGLDRVGAQVAQDDLGPRGDRRDRLPERVGQVLRVRVVAVDDDRGAPRRRPRLALGQAANDQIGQAPVRFVDLSFEVLELLLAVFKSLVSLIEVSAHVS